MPRVRPSVSNRSLEVDLSSHRTLPVLSKYGRGKPVQDPMGASRGRRLAHERTVYAVVNPRFDDHFTTRTRRTVSAVYPVSDDDEHAAAAEILRDLRDNRS